jgi:predicted HNH restriction endonuclease
MIFEPDYAEEARVARRKRDEVEDARYRGYQSGKREGAQEARLSNRSARRRAVVAAKHQSERYKRDRDAKHGPACETCGWDARRFGLDRSAALGLMNAHHIVPVCCGGADAAFNLVLLCPNCHALSHRFGRIIHLGTGETHDWTGPPTKRVFLENFAALLVRLLVLPKGSQVSEVADAS